MTKYIERKHVKIDRKSIRFLRILLNCLLAIPIEFQFPCLYEFFVRIWCLLLKYVCVYVKFVELSEYHKVSGVFFSIQFMKLIRFECSSWVLVFIGSQLFRSNVSKCSILQSVFRSSIFIRFETRVFQNSNGTWENIAWKTLQLLINGFHSDRRTL